MSASAALAVRTSAAIRHLLEENGATLYTATYAGLRRLGWLDMSPGDRGIEVDRIVTDQAPLAAVRRGLTVATASPAHSNSRWDERAEGALA